MAVSEKMVEALLLAKEFLLAINETDMTSLSPDVLRKGIALGNSLAVALEAAEAVRGGDAAPPAGTVPVRVCTAMTSVAEMPGYMEGHTFFAFSDGTIWCRGQTNGDWARVEGPPTTIHAPLPAVPEVGAVVEPAKNEWPCSCGLRPMCDGTDCGSHYALDDRP